MSSVKINQYDDFDDEIDDKRLHNCKKSKSRNNIKHMLKEAAETDDDDLHDDLEE